MNERDLYDEAGLTLVELIISIAVLGVVIIPVTTSMLLSILETNSTRDRLADSAAAQVTTSYLHGDIQSSESVATTGDCIPSSLSGGTVRLQFQWIDPTTPSVTAKAAYVDLPVGGRRELHRATCIGGSQDSTLLVPYFDTMTVRCDGVTPCASATPKDVKVAITAFSDDPDPASSYEAFTFTIDGIRRTGT